MQRRSSLMRLTLSLLLGLAFGLIPAPDRSLAAPGTVTLIPANPTLNWSAMLSNGVCADRICKVMTDLAMAQRTQQPNVCGLLEKPEARAAGIQLPTWQRQNYLQHLNEIREGILQDNIQRLYPPTQISEKRKEELKAEFWARFGSAIVALFESGDASYETAQFDIDSDNIPDDLYRLPEVEPLILQGQSTYVPAPNTRWRISTCDEARKTPVYQIFADPKMAAHLPSRNFGEVAEHLKMFAYDASVFRFDGRSYRSNGRLGGASVSETFRSPQHDYVALTLFRILFLTMRDDPGFPNHQIWRQPN